MLPCASENFPRHSPPRVASCVLCLDDFAPCSFLTLVILASLALKLTFSTSLNRMHQNKRLNRLIHLQATKILGCKHFNHLIWRNRSRHRGALTHTLDGRLLITTTRNPRTLTETPKENLEPNQSMYATDSTSKETRLGYLGMGIRLVRLARGQLATSGRC